MNTLNLKLTGGEEVQLSFQLDLIMIHGESISCQFAPDSVGVEVQPVNDLCVKVAFWPLGGNNNYQAWFFNIQHKVELLLFFKKLGYPCHQVELLKKKRKVN